MTDFVHSTVHTGVGVITLDRPNALNSLSLDMVRALTQALRSWRDDSAVRSVVIRGSTGKAFCAGGDIRFFYEVGRAPTTGGSALLEDFFSEEYALNHLTHHYPKLYIALMDGIVMGGGMGIAQGGPGSRLRIVTERTKMAMPEVNIGLFPDVGGSFFLSRTPGQIGAYLGLSGEVINAADALHAGLADLFLPSAELPNLLSLLNQANDADHRAVVHDFAVPFQPQVQAEAGMLATQRASIDRHFAHHSVAQIMDSLAQDGSGFAQATLAAMQKRSPLMMCVTLEQLRRGVSLSIADCLRMERSMVRRNFEHGEIFEGVRAMVVDKDNAPAWSPPTLDQVTPEMVARFFAPAWPDYAHPLRELE